LPFTSLLACYRTFVPMTKQLTSIYHLSSLTEWSKDHIRDVFEAPTDDAALEAIALTFSDDVIASVNGASINRDGIKQLVLSMRASAPKGLKVEWQHSVEATAGPTNQSGCFGGVYVIRGIKRAAPGSARLVDYERHKTVTVRIASQCPSQSHDSRRIVHLVFVAVDKLAERMAKL